MNSSIGLDFVISYDECSKMLAKSNTKIFYVNRLFDYFKNRKY